MKDKRFLLFDLDGTVADSAPGVMDSVEHSLKKMGITPPDRGFLAKFIGPPLRFSYMEYIGLSAEDAERGVALYREHYAVEGILNTSLFGGVKEFLAAAKEKGKVLLLATAKPEVFAKRCLANLEVDKYFDHVSAACFSPELDSKSAIVARALTMAGADKEDCVMIGDRCYDIEGAHANGIPCVGVVNGSVFEKELFESGADAVCSDFFELRKFLL